MSRRELEALAQILRLAQPEERHGPLAVVSHPDRGEFGQLCADVELCGRPARVFTSARDAREWLDSLIGTLWTPARRV